MKNPLNILAKVWAYAAGVLAVAALGFGVEAFLPDDAGDREVAVTDHVASGSCVAAFALGSERPDSPIPLAIVEQEVLLQGAYALLPVGLDVGTETANDLAAAVLKHAVGRQSAIKEMFRDQRGAVARIVFHSYRRTAEDECCAH